jgi:hypothetical protein
MNRQYWVVPFLLLIMTARQTQNHWKFYKLGVRKGYQISTSK